MKNLLWISSSLVRQLSDELLPDPMCPLKRIFRGVGSLSKSTLISSCGLSGRSTYQSMCFSSRDCMGLKYSITLPRNEAFTGTSVFIGLLDAIQYSSLLRNHCRIPCGEARGFSPLTFVQERFLVEFIRSEEHTSELQSHLNLVCRLLLEKKKKCMMY